MAKKITFTDIAAQMQKGFASVDKKFMALADDVADLKHELKGDIGRVQEQVNSIEAQLRETKIEEKVFGAPRR